MVAFSQRCSAQNGRLSCYVMIQIRLDAKEHEAEAAWFCPTRASCGKKLQAAVVTQSRDACNMHPPCSVADPAERSSITSITRFRFSSATL